MRKGTTRFDFVPDLQGVARLIITKSTSFAPLTPKSEMFFFPDLAIDINKYVLQVLRLLVLIAYYYSLIAVIT